MKEHQEQIRERKLPKWYWCDPGIVRPMKRASSGVAPEERGALFEGMLAQLLQAYKDYHGICDELMGLVNPLDFVQIVKVTNKIDTPPAA